MRALRAGWRSARRRPLALVPFAGQGIAAGVLIALGVFPAGAASAAAPAVFPLGTYFDVKQAIAYTADWGWLAAALLASAVVRGAVVASALWLSAEGSGEPGPPFARALGLAAAGALLLLPAGGMFFVAVAIRYAPFAWIGLALLALASFPLARRSLTLGHGSLGRGITSSGWLTYILVVIAVGLGLDLIGNAALVGLATAATGPLHGLLWLGWREHAETGRAYAGGRVLVAAAALAAASVLATGVIDRLSGVPHPHRAAAPGTLLLMGGVDSTSTTGALVDLDPRWLGHKDAKLLSYAGTGRKYTRLDTHGDLEAIAVRVAEQLSGADPPRWWLGHSQSGLILDRIVSQGLKSPDRAVDLAAPPAPLPPVEVPPPGRSGAGRVGSDCGRFLSWLFERAGLTPFDVDAPASPVHLRSVPAGDATPRLAVWALGDSVWLYGDWRRAGATDLVALSDHVGVTKNGRVLDSARRFYAGRDVSGDERSWRGLLVEAVQAAFAPWRPDR